jgi:hypothetical protein
MGPNLDGLEGKVIVLMFDCDRVKFLIRSEWALTTLTFQDLWYWLVFFKLASRMLIWHDDIHKWFFFLLGELLL